MFSYPKAAMERAMKAYPAELAADAVCDGLHAFVLDSPVRLLATPPSPSYS
jgi:hypothetical protein